MVLSDWYLRNAVFCGQMAENATDAATRARYESEKQSWLEIAVVIGDGDPSRSSPSLGEPSSRGFFGNQSVAHEDRQE